MSKYPSQDHFNSEHDTPREYGESDYVLIGTQYDAETAKRLLIEEVKSWVGETDFDEVYDADSFGKYPVGIGTNEDGEPDYVAYPREGNRLFEAWGFSQ